MMENAAVSEMVSLAGTLTPLKDYFNAGKGNIRFLALLSPTCPK